MIWFTSLIVSIVGGLSSLLLAGFIANACVSWYRISSREGASGYFVVFVALGGGVVGLIVSFISAQIVASIFGPGFFKAFGGAIGVVVLIAGVAALVCRLLAHAPSTRDEEELPTPPPRDDAAEQAAAKEAEFVAIPADAPLSQWLPYTGYSQPQTERALLAIAKRPNLAREIEELSLGEDHELACQAIRCAGKLPPPLEQFNAPMQRVGQDLAERIRKVNAVPVEQDPSYLGAANVSMRFTAWHQTIRGLREKSGGDFTPELRTILELSRLRKDSQSMQMDICRVASYYLHEWAGDAPLPSDPKPR